MILALLATGEELTWLDYLSRASVIVFFIIMGYGFLKSNPWFVTGREHREALARESEFKSMALHSLQTAESAAAVGEHLVERNRALREGEA